MRISEKVITDTSQANGERRKAKSKKQIIAIALLILVICSCSRENSRHLGKLKIVVTTGMLGDAVKNITGDSADVFVLMGPGVDPHLYKPTPRDVDKLAEADIIIYNGLHLEGKMGEILEKISRKKKVIAISMGISKEKLIGLNEDNEKEKIYDPHIWFDVNLWREGVLYLGKKLAEADSINKMYFLENSKEYSDKLKELDEWTREQISQIPEERRVLITAHDAFSYFGKAYDIEVIGLQGISTVAEPGLKDITNLTDLLAARKIKAVFVESSVSGKAISAVIYGAREKGHQVNVGGTLFSDAMGDEGTEEGTYIGMVRHNVITILKGFK
jgi:manganese/zinc/iron transport system substrate-binding protein